MSEALTPQALEADGWRRRRLPGFIELVGPLWARKEDTGWAFGVVMTEQHLNPVGVVHGGMLATLADHGLSVIAWEQVGRKPCVTVQLDTRFLAPGRAGQFLQIRGSVTHATGSMLFTRGRVECEGSVLLEAQSIMKLMAPAAG